MLDKLSERGRGAYVFLGSEAEVDRIFGEDFISLLETVARDVHFRLILPPELEMKRFYGEEASENKEEVQAIHYFANSQQLFLQDLTLKGGSLPDTADLALDVEYTTPDTEEKRVEHVAWKAGTIRVADDPTIRKARLILTLVDTVRGAAQADRSGGEFTPQQICERADTVMAQLAEGLDDPEVRRVLELNRKFCRRFGGVMLSASLEPREEEQGSMEDAEEQEVDWRCADVYRVAASQIEEHAKMAPCERIEQEMGEQDEDDGFAADPVRRAGHGDNVRGGGGGVRMVGSGRIDPRVVHRTVRRYLPQIRTCHEQAMLKRGRKMSGRMEMQFTIMQNGRTGNVKVRRSTINDSYLTSCITAWISRWKFTRPRGGTKTIVYPFTFTTAN